MLNFAWPLMIILAPLPILMRFMMPIAKEKSNALNVSFIPDLKSLDSDSGSAKQENTAMMVAYTIIWLLLVLAAMRPQTVKDTFFENTEGRDIMLAIDSSESMSRGARLDFVKKQLSFFVDEREGDELGLIIFGDFAVQLAPLTYDRKTIAKWISETHIGQAGTHTAIGDAIGLAAKVLSQKKEGPRVLILMTDGVNNIGTLNIDEALELAVANKLKVYAIGIGSSGYYNGFDEDTLRNIASETGGKYFDAGSSNGFGGVLDAINRLEPVEKPSPSVKILVEHYQVPLVMALLLSALLIIYLSAKNRYKWVNKI